MALAATNHSSRRGFTLLELLVVVAIISILMGLSVVVLYGVTDTAQEQATATTIRKINGLLEQRIESFNRAFGRTGSFRQRYVDATTALLQQKEIYGVRQEVVEILARKVAFRHQFPQRHEDLLKLDFDPAGVVPWTAFDGDTLFPVGSTTGALADGQRDILDGNWDMDGGIVNQIHDDVEKSAADPSKLPAVDSPVNDKTVSSELLYYTLVHSGNFGASANVADQFSASEVDDTDDDGLLEFVDAYGEPLRFYRWPTRLIDRDAPVPFQPDLADLNDNTDVLQTVGATTVGVRVVDGSLNGERDIAQTQIKGLPPAPVDLPSGALPRDLLFVDPDDPIGRLYSEMERLNGLNNSPLLRAEYNETWYHTPETFHTPLIVSSGPDLRLGLYEPSDTANLGNLANYDTATVDDLFDNITNRNRRAGARR